MGLLQKILSSGAGKLIKDVGGVLDNLTTSKEEKLAAEQKIKELISNHELELQKQVTNRWEADMKSDSWLSKNVRPLVLMFLVVSLLYHQLLFSSSTRTTSLNLITLYIRSS